MLVTITLFLVPLYCYTWGVSGSLKVKLISLFNAVNGNGMYLNCASKWMLQGLQWPLYHLKIFFFPKSLTNVSYLDQTKYLGCKFKLATTEVDQPCVMCISFTFKTRMTNMFTVPVCSHVKPPWCRQSRMKTNKSSGLFLRCSLMNVQFL